MSAPIWRKTLLGLGQGVAAYAQEDAVNWPSFPYVTVCLEGKMSYEWQVVLANHMAFQLVHCPTSVYAALCLENVVNTGNWQSIDSTSKLRYPRSQNLVPGLAAKWPPASFSITCPLGTVTNSKASCWMFPHGQSYTLVDRAGTSEGLDCCTATGMHILCSVLAHHI